MLMSPESRRPPRAAKMRTEGLTAGYGETSVLNGVDFRLPSTSVTALIGPSGSGKSTFLRCLNRMHELADDAFLQGRVWLDEQDIYQPEVPPAALRRKVGMVFQTPNPFPTMSVEGNVLAGLHLAGGHAKLERPEQHLQACLEAAALWDEVKDRLSHPATTLSGGQQQRLCIARALAMEPEVLLMDEPCSSLDPIATAHIEELLAQLSQTYAILVVTHNMQQAARISLNTGFFLRGELVEFGHTDQMFRSPEHQETEDYITGKFG